MLNALRPEPGSSIGSSAIMAARLAGCAQIIAVERHANRREIRDFESGGTIKAVLVVDWKR